MTEAHHKPGAEAESRMRAEVARKARQRASGARDRDRGIWFSLGLFGVVGWSIALPTLLGVALGVWIDTRWPSRVSWTLTLLFVGIVMGCVNAWRWIRHESGEE
jgi:ATP synthase protein I